MHIDIENIFRLSLGKVLIERLNITAILMEKKGGKI
jgi:hypothetical protein